MAPSLKFRKESLVQDEFEAKLRKLKEVLPNIPQTRLAALITEEKGNLEAIVSRIMMCEDEQEAERDMERQATILQMEKDKENELVSTVTVDTDVLKSILHKAKESETASNADTGMSGKVLSFHKPETSTVSLCKETTRPDPRSLSLSSYVCGNRTRVYCNSCAKTVDNGDNYNFCPYCGYLLRKNYRRL